MSVSILILTLNEEVNLLRCLRSVSWSDDVVVLDSFSTDRTLKIAELANARVFQRPFDDFASQRNWGIENASFKYEWVLHLDADEVVPAEMRDEIGEAIRDKRYSAYRMSLKLMFQERWIKHASMFPAFQVRLGRRERLRFKMVGHGQREDLPVGEIGTLSTSLIHYSFGKGLSYWFEKHNRYSTAEAHENLRLRVEAGCGFSELFSMDRGVRWRALKRLSSRLPCRPMFRFFYMSVIKRGFLDGIPGLHYCLLVVIYEYMIVLKVEELRQRETSCIGENSTESPNPSLSVPRPAPAFALRLGSK